MSSKPAYKKRRITPTAGYGTISAGAMASSFNKKVTALQKQVSRIEKSREVKHEDSAVSFNIDATGEVPATGQWTAGCVQGTNGTERVGEKITVRSIQFRGGLTYTPTASFSIGTTVHLYIILDKQCNGAAAAATDVFTSANFALALRSRSRSDRFKILWHGEFNLQPQTISAAAGGQIVTMPFSMYKRVNIPVKYSGSTGAVADVMTNNIFLMAGSDGNSDDLVACAGTGRLNFTDD